MGSSLRIEPQTNPRLSSRSDGVTIDSNEWELVARSGANAVLYGSAAALKATLSTLRSHLVGPVRICAPGKCSLANLSAGTLILEQASSFSVEQQDALLAWLDAAHGVQVIATTEQPLFDSVERGAFRASLYYRLNTVFIDLDSAL